MNERNEMILSAMLMFDQLAELFDVTADKYPDFHELAERIRGYRDDLAQAAKTGEGDFGAYKRAIMNEINAVDGE